MRNGDLRVSPLRRGTFVKQPQKYPKRPRPRVRPSLRSGSLAPVPLRGHAATGHPWPIAALPASMPGHPLRRTSTRPPEGADRSKTKATATATATNRSKDRRLRQLHKQSARQLIWLLPLLLLLIWLVILMLKAPLNPAGRAQVLRSG